MPSVPSTPSAPSARRPLKTRDAKWARALARLLARQQVSPNGISLLSLLFAGLGAIAMLAVPAVEPATQILLLLLAAGCIQLRLLCNLLDGMVAVEGGLGSRAGEVYNDLPDRLADPLLIVPAGYACGLPWGPELAWTAGCLALLTAYLRMLGGACGLAQDFRGPMAKPHRMASMAVGLLVAAIMVPLDLYGPALMVTLALVALGAAWTALRRTRAIVAALESR
ncbi:CDP-alcohol phosphatidyltransferase family protein [Thiorhodovibrio frisius]|uniref:Phosphatidylglycerophosphate synthase n=1 Tax=Thiorhodovibrio frisius TaxID=631362 RepID=H8Z7U6_9GAMM|nr:CDP-alcohol phosphatidyltransferase family protein [Thiorhodovibrio frisius]EIC20958.1 phosphatidylglycerophosphate synthase [Thiorhodovibrio frisius]WPL22017.1 CDP-alcohol phosphatidyltransferase [Thiorhodovibrio frisius]